MCFNSTCESRRRSSIRINSSCSWSFLVVRESFPMEVFGFPALQEDVEDGKPLLASTAGGRVISGCGKHQEYKECQSGSCGEWKCSFLYTGWPIGCTYDCQTGCFCKHGYFRNSKNKCVKGWKCFKEYTMYKPFLSE
ncbi:uncharacterized protein LOC142589782 isoform X2 [Dermacentor variabilis]|uniref:uncharacterized protein LOC142589782 isoform X2 n=1 Tax=Dermacentor variabilis TaxID=34621 RepID=UPI003F5BBCA5